MSAPVTTQWITIADGGEAYLCVPPAGHGPGLVLFQEIFGVNSHIRAVAEQWALSGFVVLAPDVFWRAAPRVELGYQSADIERGMQLAGQLKAEPIAADLAAWVAALRGRPEVGAAKVGAIGYCMGGRFAYLAAALAGVDAAVAYYGGGIHNQLALAAKVACPIQFHYAGRDDHIPSAAVQSVRDAFAGKPAEVFVYPASMHGFNCWARASYHPASAALAQGRSLAFLAEKLF